MPPSSTTNKYLNYLLSIVYKEFMLHRNFRLTPSIFREFSRKIPRK
jgi:hypothetical protein